MSLILTLFARREDLERAVDALREAGAADRVGVAAREDVARALIADDERRPKNMRFGTGLGAAAGAAAGLVVGAFSLPLGGIPVLLLGALAGSGLGAAGGAAAGAAAGGLAIGQDEGVMLEAVRSGEYLLSVEIPDDRRENIARLLHEHGGERQVIRPGRLPDELARSPEELSG